MHILKNLYQTIDDRNDPDSVIEHGPFFCKKNPWLGKGFYFWDNLLERAHWWGKTHYRNKYMICCADAFIDDSEYLDLVGNMTQLNFFRDCCGEIKKTYPKDLTIPFVLQKLMKDGNFPFKAIRVRSEYCGGHKLDNTLKFVKYHESYMDLNPPVQICIYDKSLIKNYHIVYPQQYCCLEGVV